MLMTYDLNYNLGSVGKKPGDCEDKEKNNDKHNNDKVDNKMINIRM